MKTLIASLIFAVVALVSVILMVNIESHKYSFLAISLACVCLSYLLFKVEQNHEQKKRENLLGLAIIVSNVVILCGVNMIF